jgi:hypothetical protein
MFNLGQIPHSFTMRPARVSVDINPSDENGRREHQGERNMGINEDKVGVTNIFDHGGRGGGDGGMGGLGAAAMVAALGGRNERGYGGDGFGFGGGGGLGALLAIALLGRDGFGFGGRGGFDRGGDCCDQIGQQVILGKLGSIEGAIPAASLSIENSILSQTNALQGSIGSLALGLSQGLANVKDSVQANSALNLAATAGVKDAVQTGTSVILQAICSATKEITNQAQAFQTANDSRLINAQAAEIIELRNDRDNRGRHAALELQITNTNTAVAAQQQAQAQFQLQGVVNAVQSLVPAVNALLVDNQIAVARATNANFNIGNTGAVTNAAQSAAANPVNVRA